MLLNPSEKVAIDCHRLECPELDIERYYEASPSVLNIPAVQESTMQVPCGKYSIFDLSCHDLSSFDISVYLVINWKGDWDTGVSHGLSYQQIADILGVKHREQVIRSIKRLIKAGFLKKHAKRKSDGANIYEVVHHNCAPEDVPLDKDNRPQKCAIPAKAGSPMQLMAEGKLSWRLMLQWVTSKINSDWISGIVKQTVREVNQRLRFSMQTICDNAKQLCQLGLMERLSKPHEASEYQLYPGPYPDRRERADYKGKKPLPLIGDWYYSYSKRWRFHKESLRLMMEDVDGRWRDTGMSELLTINPKIHADFREYMDILSSRAFENLRRSLGVPAFACT